MNISIDNQPSRGFGTHPPRKKYHFREITMASFIERLALSSLQKSFSSGLVVTAMCSAWTQDVQASYEILPPPDLGPWTKTLMGRDLDGDSSNGYEAYYDTLLNITWLADANHAKTSGYDVDGLMGWDASMTWVNQLVVNGVGGWRLPTLVDVLTPGCSFAYANSDCGFNVDQRSELAHMYYGTLGNKPFMTTAGGPTSGEWGLKNTGPFVNLMDSQYWIGTPMQPTGNLSWMFETHNGMQYHAEKPWRLYAWAVHDGDVSAVPEPQTGWLFLAGGLLVAASRKRAPCTKAPGSI